MIIKIDFNEMNDSDYTDLPVRSVLPELVAALDSHSGAVLAAAPGAGRKTMVVFSGDLDKVLAALVIANGALAMGDSVTLVSSAEETAKDVYRVLAATERLRSDSAPPPVHRFLATGDPEPFERLGRRFLGPEIGDVGHVSAGAFPATGTRII